MKDPEGIDTTIARTPSGQLLVTFPKGLAKLKGIQEGMKVKWLLDENSGQAVGRVIT
jgi:hypothetical protein